MWLLPYRARKRGIWRASDHTAMTFKDICKEEIAKGNLDKEIVYLLDQTPTRVNITLNGIPLNNPESIGAFLVDLPDFASSVGNIQIQREVGASTNDSVMTNPAEIPP